jgi:C4-dicarboxylate-specific signal transduction histidine kinase
MLLQVLINLYKNSIDACADSNNRTVNVGIFMNKESPTIQIQDSGIGFKNLEMVGKKFFTSKTDGLGLGLSLSHSIIKFHKGEMKYQNSPEGGAIVTITFNRT